MRGRRHVHLRGLSGMSVDVELTYATGVGPSRRWEATFRAQAPDFEFECDGRPLTHRELMELAEFCQQAAVQQFPERTLPALCLDGPGVVFDVVGSSPDAITVELRFGEDPGPDAVDGFSFDTTGLALLHAADQIRGNGGPPDASSRLFDPALQYPFQALVWDLVQVPDLSRLDGISVPDGTRPAPGGQVGQIRGYAFQPGCDAALELDLLRLGMPHAIAGMLGSFADGERFGILVLQSDPLMDQQAWDALAGTGAGPTDPLARWEAVEVYIDAFNVAAAPAEQRAVFARLDGFRLLSAAVIEEHLAAVYRYSGEPAVTGLSDRPFDGVLLALLAEAVGVPLPRVLSAHDCVLPGWKHTCQHDPIADAMAAWIAGDVSPEQFREFAIRDRHQLPPDDRPTATRAGRTRPRAPRKRGSCTQSPLPEPHLPGGFELRFRHYLGSGDAAPASIATVFAHARRADEADRRGDDDGVLDALNSALSAVDQLLADDPPKRYEAALREIQGALSDIFAPFTDDDAEDDR